MGVRQTASEIPRGTVSNAAFGVALFVFTEVMLFAGFISAFGIVRDNALPGAWPPPGQPRLPIARTAPNRDSVRRPCAIARHTSASSTSATTACRACPPTMV